MPGTTAATTHRALLLVKCALVAATLPPDARYEYADWSTKLQEDLLAGYNRHVVPKSDRSKQGTTFSAAGTNVEMALRIFKVIAVKPADGAMELKVWLRMYWQDERLSWDPAKYGNITKTHFWGDPAPTSGNSQIWIPDIQPYNGLKGIVATLDPAYARVEHTGDIFFSRPGTMNVMCKFSGLTAFPFDELKCGFEFGGWAWSGEQQGILLKGLGYDFSAQEATQGSTYQEYTVSNVSVVRVNYEYPCCPSEPWPVTVYTVSLKRATSFYVVVIIVPTIIVTMLSFVVFWAPSSSADALGFGITVIVVVILMQVVLIDLLPVCGEILWVDIFVSVSYTFCMMSLFQSALVILIETNETEHLLPLIIVHPAKVAWQRLRHYSKHLLCLQHKVVPTEHDEMDQSKRAKNLATLAESASVQESIAGVQYRLYGPGVQRLAAQAEPVTGDAQDGRNMTIAPEDMPKLIFFEKLFFSIDEDNTGEISEDECTLLFSFVALDMPYDERMKAFMAADKVADGHLTRMEFCELCRTTLWDMPLPTIEMAVENLKCARLALRDRYKNYWQSVAESLESAARPILPSMYIAANVVLFNLDFNDDYDTNVERIMGDAGYLKVSLRTGGVVWIVVLCLLIIVIVGSRRAIKKLSYNIGAAKKASEIEAVRALNTATQHAKNTIISRNDIVETSKGSQVVKFEDC